MFHTSVRALALLVSAVAATALAWVAASPPMTATVAPAAVGWARLP
jgi:hypothetical protein